jgi:glycosyltransferase involved in cell wall biosynthesis
MKNREGSPGTRPMTVLVVCHYYPPHVGGIEEVARAQAVGLARRGVSVTVITSSTGARPDATWTDPGVRVIRVPALNVLQRFGVPFPLFSPSLLRTGWNAVGRADVVHLHDTLYLSSWVIALCCWLQRTPWVVTKHVAVVAHPWHCVAWAQRLVYGTVGAFASRGAEVVFYVNTRVRDSLKSGGTAADRLAPLPNGVDLGTFTPSRSTEEHVALRRRLGLPADQLIVLFVGRLVHKKGYRRLVEAAEGQTSWMAVLVGDGDVVEQTSRVLPYGAQNHDTVRLLYQACDIFALPSQCEGFPLTVQEAMASGLPVVTTNDPGYDMYGLDPDFVALLDPRGPDLKDVIDALAADPQKRRHMAQYSRRFAEDNFSWDGHVTTLMRTYQALVLERPYEQVGSTVRP